MAQLAAAVARFLAIWAIARNVAALVAIVARQTAALVAIAFTLTVAIRAVAGQMAGFVAIVAAWIVWGLAAVTSNVTGTCADSNKQEAKRKQKRMNLDDICSG